MPNAARIRGNIRTPESLERQQTAQKEARRVLTEYGFTVTDYGDVYNRHVIGVVDPSGRARKLWFKLGWNPAGHGSTAVQITMFKKTDGIEPSKFPAKVVRTLVEQKFARAKNDGLSDLLLFSLDNEARVPIVAVLISIDAASEVFLRYISTDMATARKGASPVLWLIGEEMGPLPISLRKQVANLYEYNGSSAGVFSWHE